MWVIVTIKSMGTSGLYIFVYRGNTYTFYNSMDSYPEALGRMLVLMIKTENVEGWGAILEDIFVNKNYKVTRKVTRVGNRNCVDYYNYTKDNDYTGTDDLEPEQWYSQRFTSDGGTVIYNKWEITRLIYHCPLILTVIKKFCPTLLDTSEYIPGPVDTTDYSWVYTINLDTNRFKVEGGTQEPEFKLDSIPYNWIDQI